MFSCSHKNVIKNREYVKESRVFEITVNNPDRVELFLLKESVAISGDSYEDRVVFNILEEGEYILSALSNEYYVSEQDRVDTTSNVKGYTVLKREKEEFQEISIVAYNKENLGNEAKQETISFVKYSGHTNTSFPSKKISTKLEDIEVDERDKVDRVLERAIYTALVGDGLDKFMVNENKTKEKQKSYNSIIDNFLTTLNNLFENKK